MDYQELAREYVVRYFNLRSEKTDGYILKIEDVYVVWFSKTLQNWKALVSTNVSDGMYYEITYNGDKNETYLDAYKKFENVQLNEEKLTSYPWNGAPEPSAVSQSYPWKDGHDHIPVHHRDGKAAWCNRCGLDANYSRPTDPFRSESVLDAEFKETYKIETKETE